MAKREPSLMFGVAYLSFLLLSFLLGLKDLIAGFDQQLSFRWLCGRQQLLPKAPKDVGLNGDDQQYGMDEQTEDHGNLDAWSYPPGLKPQRDDCRSGKRKGDKAPVPRIRIPELGVRFQICRECTKQDTAQSQHGQRDRPELLIEERAASANVTSYASAWHALPFVNV